MNCPKCDKILDPAQHAELIFDGQVWCSECHYYDWDLIRPRSFLEIQAWSRLICANFDWAPVLLETDTEPTRFRQETSVLLAEADHRHRAILFFPPGYRLSTLCHELAHLLTGQDHTWDWAETFARLVAWVKAQLAEDRGPEGFQARLSIYAGVSKRVY
jgi:hypothetical protein